jgi:hypothetical protein
MKDPLSKFVTTLSGGETSSDLPLGLFLLSAEFRLSHPLSRPSHLVVHGVFRLPPCHPLPGFQVNQRGFIQSFKLTLGSLDHRSRNTEHLRDIKASSPLRLSSTEIIELSSNLSLLSGLCTDGRKKSTI